NTSHLYPYGPDDSHARFRSHPSSCPRSGVPTTRPSTSWMPSRIMPSTAGCAARSRTETLPENVERRTKHSVSSTPCGSENGDRVKRAPRGGDVSCEGTSNKKFISDARRL